MFSAIGRAQVFMSGMVGKVEWPVARPKYTPASGTGHNRFNFHWQNILHPTFKKEQLCTVVLSVVSLHAYKVLMKNIHTKQAVQIRMIKLCKHSTTCLFVFFLGVCAYGSHHSVVSTGAKVFTRKRNPLEKEKNVC